MYKSIALSTVFLRTTTAQSGCHPAWVSGSSYSSGSLVSAVRVVNATAGTTITKNFECTSGDRPDLSHCPNLDPANEAQAPAAWSDLGECSGVAVTSAPTTKPTHAAWAGLGCPADWVEDHFYDGGDLAAIDGIVYKCSEVEFVNAWCGNPSYKPGDSANWEQAWTLLGSCTGTIAPSTSPVYVSITDGGGCPDTFSPDETYKEGDKVEMNGLAYECRTFPNSGWCSRATYEPNGVNSADAWTLLGYCDGTIAPTASPVFASLPDAGGCPDVYSDTATYEASDKVAMEVSTGNLVVYECTTSSGYCNMYEPGHWSKLGWVLKGYCSGTIAPTSSPVFELLEDHNGCPEAYSDTVTYEANDKVSTDIDGTNSLVWQCSSDVHQAKYCPYHEPGDGTGLGWTLVAHCTGTIAPTTSPIFDGLTDTGGCPPAYDEATGYSPGDVASVILSDAPERVVVYECKPLPEGAYCNAGPNFSPESDNASMGWNLKGSCAGTISPTVSPTVYPDPKCRWYNGTQAVIITNWAEASLPTYGAGTRVRKEDRIYKCKGYPYSLWCKMAAYEPEETMFWAEAWTPAGTCVDMFAPTSPPSVSPTASPSRAPTKAPTKSPTAPPM